MSGPSSNVPSMEDGCNEGHHHGGNVVNGESTPSKRETVASLRRMGTSIASLDGKKRNNVVM